MDEEEFFAWLESQDLADINVTYQGDGYEDWVEDDDEEEPEDEEEDN